MLIIPIILIVTIFYNFGFVIGVLSLFLLTILDYAVMGMLDNSDALREMGEF